MKEPKIRFKGFKGEWEEKKIGTMTSVRGGYAFQSSLFQKSGIPVVRISNILSNGNVGGDFAYYPRLDGDTNITIHEKDVVIAMSGATTGKIARVDVGDGILYQNQRVGLFTKTGKVDYDFLYAVLNRPHFNELLNKLLTSSAQPNASSADIESIEMGFPEDAEEQKALSNYILSLDSLIQSTTKKIESLKQVKAASLQSMFPQEGETTPRVRFKGFKGEWKIEKIGNFSTSFSGGTPTAGVPAYYGGNIPFIRSGEIHEDKTELSLTEKGYNNSSAKIVEKGTLLYALYGATSGDVAISKIRGAINQAILAITPYKLVETDFLADFLLCNKVKIVGELLQGGQGNLSGSLVKDINVAYPCISEQRAIASYFTTLDRQITLQTQRLEKLKQIKSACLDNMFV